MTRGRDIDKKKELILLWVTSENQIMDYYSSTIVTYEGRQNYVLTVDSRIVLMWIRVRWRVQNSLYDYSKAQIYNIHVKLSTEALDHWMWDLSLDFFFTSCNQFVKQFWIVFCAFF